MSIADGDLTDVYQQFFGSPTVPAPPSAPALSTISPDQWSQWSEDQARAYEEQQQTYREGLKQQLAQSKAQLDYQYKALAQQAKTAQQQLALQKWYQRQQIDLLNKSAKLERDKFGLQKQQFQFQKDSFAQQQGLDILKFQASLSGPANFVQSANFARGVASNPAQAAFVQSLLSGANGRLFGPSAGQPQAQSLGSLASLFGGGGSPTSGSTTADQLANGPSDGGLGSSDLALRAQQAQNLVAAAQRLGAAGGGSLGAQALESLSPDERGLLQSGFSQSGYSFDDYLNQYNRSRVGQGSALAA